MENFLKLIDSKSLTLFKEKKFLIIAGPCVIEDADTTISIAESLIRSCEKLEVPLVFKASYDKANRTSLTSFRGVGMDEGLAVLNHIRETYDIPVLSDIHSINEIEKAALVLDFIQIPAFLCRQTDLVIEAAKTHKIINVKKGQFVSPQEMKYVVEKILSTGNKKILLTERGTFFGYGNLVNDFRSIKIMSAFAPVIYDCTHSVQNPGMASGESGGSREFIPLLARAAAASGISGMYLEVHPEPDKSPSDSKSILPLDRFEELMFEIIEINKLVNSFPHWNLK